MEGSTGDDQIAAVVFGCELRLNNDEEWDGCRLLLPLSTPTQDTVGALEAANFPRGPDHHGNLTQ